MTVSKKSNQKKQQHKQSQRKSSNPLTNKDLLAQIEEMNKKNKLSPAVTTKKFKKGVKEISSDQHEKESKVFESKFKINLPQSVADIFLKDKSIEIDNLHLLHHKYSLQFYDEETCKIEKPESFLKAVKLPSYGRIKIDGKWKTNKKPRPAPCKINETAIFKIGLDEINETAASDFELVTRTEELAKECGVVTDPICFEFKVLDKLVIGMGGESPYDSLLLMALHPLYGLPYLPATAIKGMLLSYYEQTEELEKRERDQLFGCEENAGQLVFFDTFPNEFEIKFDVMTPHYKDYYGDGKNAPTDDQDTNIITFPCVAEDAVFNVYITCRDQKLWSNYSKKVARGIEKAFKYYGIGAKTALGYGLGK